MGIKQVLYTFATWIFRDLLSPASKSRYGWKIAKSTLILKTINQPTNLRNFDLYSKPLINLSLSIEETKE